jgi:signal transduction histidine kinase
MRAHPDVGDALVAVVLLVGALPMYINDGVRGVALAVGLAAPLAVRRRYPVAVWAMVSAVAFAQWLVDVPVAFVDVAVLIALYTVTAYGPSRRIAGISGAVCLGGAGLAVVRWHEGRFVAGLIGPVALTLVALALGDDRRSRRAYFAELEERAHRLEREQHALAAVAAGAERARIARELHDVVAHSLTVMVAQADGAALTIDRDPTRAAGAMVVVAETGRASLTEMRRLLGVLRPASPTTERDPQPGFDQLGPLVERVAAAGLAVELTVDDNGHDFPPGLGLAAYRIVQEALTNTMKHSGPGATVSVHVRAAPDALSLRIADDGAGVRSPNPDNQGSGLQGMRERVALYDGTVTASARPSGGFEVVACFPLPVHVP